MEAVTLTVPLVALPILNNKMTIENPPTPSVQASPAEKERYKVHGACSAGSRGICWMALDSKPRRAAAMWLPAALQTVVGEADHDRLMPRNSQIQFRYHRMPNLDWTGIDPLPSMESDALSMPLVPPRDPTTK